MYPESISSSMRIYPIQVRSIAFLLCFFSLSLAVLVPWLDNDPFYKLQLEDEAIHSRQISDLPSVVPPEELTDETRSLPKHLTKVPQYVVDNCPLVHLYSEERYWPYDIKNYVNHFHLRESNGAKITTAPDKLTLQDLRAAYTFSFPNGTETKIASSELYMTSNEDFSKDPYWIVGSIPEYGTGHIKDAPAILIVVDKGNGWVDAFWFYFYPFNWGPFIMGGGPWGNHVGDWEHSLVRFHMGEPKYLWMSAHAGGTAYKFETIEKVRKLKRVNGKLQNEIIYRPLIFSARGTHANYASVGQHWHDVPFFFMPLSDFTDRGPMWDPVLNYYAYAFNGEDLDAIGDKAKEIGTEWLAFSGLWGDKQLPWKDSRQRWCPVQWKYIDGPTGPFFKHLERTSLCESFKWWNIWKGCPARRYIKRGTGLDAERNDVLGDNCGILLYNIRPLWLRGIARFLMWRGFVCAIMDYFTG
ncbi:hypothetical protein KAFR_0C02050 [Kazachstania africana CBS 2517]|uniref:Vacuolar protein sorting-associated protein 62 n=1 Tax=Kazachstania africana (strain ATCC 22294 / BCRC 22015 / CBS 2517 / CECT 1963 / NBRC 1671 / NRRL Y-8276) TaxID=1071382 RepID=H2AS48_KAZAF|nr:hypothetical protein KAFR_0C02050 [Kazachstania africana CBS 2517]CCF57198.1 hypothetical protein KAFR_0C02050 [Kazachstania africana CBS 2517]